MAILRPRRRQGGSSRRRAGRRSQVVGGQASATFDQPRPQPVAAPAPSPTYAPVAKPPTPVAPVAGPSSTALRANAEQAMNAANTANRDAIFRAAMQLGDPTIFAKLQADPNMAGYKFAQDPNSIFASLARQQTEGFENIDEGAAAGNTYFSGLRLGDRSELSNRVDRDRLAGSTAYLDDLKQIAAILAAAQGDYRQAIADADQMDIDAALALAREDNSSAADDAAAMAAGGGPAKGIPAGPGVIQTDTRSEAEQRHAAQQFDSRRDVQEEEARQRRRARRRRNR